MNGIEQLNKNAKWVFFIALINVWGLIKPLFENVVTTNKMPISEYYSHYDWVGLIAQLIVLFVLYNVIKTNDSINKRTERTTRRFERASDEFHSILRNHKKKVHHLEAQNLVMHYSLLYRINQLGVPSSNEEIKYVKDNLLRLGNGATAMEIKQVVAAYYKKDVSQLP